jgi:hypothetical protein
MVRAAGLRKSAAQLLNRAVDAGRRGQSRAAQTLRARAAKALAEAAELEAKGQQRAARIMERALQKEAETIGKQIAYWQRAARTAGGSATRKGQRFLRKVSKLQGQLARLQSEITRLAEVGQRLGRVANAWNDAARHGVSGEELLRSRQLLRQYDEIASAAGQSDPARVALQGLMDHAMSPDELALLYRTLARSGTGALDNVLTRVRSLVAGDRSLLNALRKGRITPSIRTRLKEINRILIGCSI